MSAPRDTIFGTAGRQKMLPTYVTFSRRLRLSIVKDGIVDMSGFLPLAEVAGWIVSLETATRSVRGSINAGFLQVVRDMWIVV